MATVPMPPSVSRIEAFLARWKRARNIDQDAIHRFDAGCSEETALRQKDLEEVLAALEAQRDAIRDLDAELLAIETGEGIDLSRPAQAICAIRERIATLRKRSAGAMEVEGDAPGEGPHHG